MRERHRGLMTVLPCVVSAVRLDEVHVAVPGQESHQLFIGPEEGGGQQLSIISSDNHRNTTLPNLHHTKTKIKHITVPAEEEVGKFNKTEAACLILHNNRNVLIM